LPKRLYFSYIPNYTADLISFVANGSSKSVSAAIVGHLDAVKVNDNKVMKIFIVS
jgi:hypothetical protein